MYVTLKIEGEDKIKILWLTIRWLKSFIKLPRRCEYLHQHNVVVVTRYFPECISPEAHYVRKMLSRLGRRLAGIVCASRFAQKGTKAISLRRGIASRGIIAGLRRVSSDLWSACVLASNENKSKYNGASDNYSTRSPKGVAARYIPAINYSYRPRLSRVWCPDGWPRETRW